MTVQKLTKESFRDFGQILTMDDLGPVNQENEFDWYDTAGKIDLAEKCCTGMLVCRPREKKVIKMERHARTSEVLVALNGDTVLTVAPAEDSLENNDGIRAFLLREGTSVVMRTGTWHWVPFPVQDEEAKILVLFRDGTGNEDLSLRDLSREISID